MNVGGHAGDFVAQLGKLHAPRKIRRLAPATAGSEAALTSEEVADRDARRARVRGFPPRQPVSLHQKVPGDDRADQAAVKNATGTQEVERQELPRTGTIL